MEIPNCFLVVPSTASSFHNRMSDEKRQRLFMQYSELSYPERREEKKRLYERRSNSFPPFACSYLPAPLFPVFACVGCTDAGRLSRLDTERLMSSAFTAMESNVLFTVTSCCLSQKSDARSNNPNARFSRCPCVLSAVMRSLSVLLLR